MKNYMIAALMAIMLSCASEDDQSQLPAMEPLQISNFSIISFDDDAFYEYRFDQGTQEAVSFNLTAQQSIDRQVFQVHRNESVFGFYNLGNAFLKDFSSNQLFFVDDFGGEPGEERIIARNDNVTLGIVYTFPNSSEYFLRVIDVVNSSRFNIPLGELSSNVQLYIQGETVFIIHNQGGETKLIKVDKSTQHIAAELEVGENLSGIVFGDDQSFFTFNFAGSYTQYAIENLELLNEGTSSFVPNDTFTFKYRNGVIYSQFEYPQPNFYPFGPQAFDLATGEEELIDIAGIFDTYVSTDMNTAAIQPIHFDYDVRNQVWIVAFVAQNEEEVDRFGYLVIDTEGEILRETSLDRAPWTVVVHN